MIHLLVLLAIQSANNAPIIMRDDAPARVVTESKTSYCGAVAFDLNYSATRQGVRGSLIVRKGDQLFEAPKIQSGIFANLSYIDSTAVACGPDGRASILISGTDQKTGEVGRLWQLSFSPEGGFDDPMDISG